MMQILIVDDDLDVRKVLRLYLEEQGHRGIEAGDGNEGLEMARKHRPDAIISDGLMPQMDGYQFLRALKQDKALQSIPFVFYTAVYADEKSRELGLSLGADAFIVKPKSPPAFWEEFIAAVEEHRSSGKSPAQNAVLQECDAYLEQYSRIVARVLERKVFELERVNEDLSRTKGVLQESEKHYRLLFEANPHPMWVYDVETLAFLAVNNAAVSHYGYSRNEFLSMTIKDIRPAEDVPELIEKVAQAAPGISGAAVWRHRKKDSTIFDAEITTHTVTFSGRPAKLVMAVDVTERLRMANEIRDAANAWRNTFDAISDPIALLDRDGGILRCNSAMADLAGKNFQEIIGRQCWEIVHGASGPVADCPLQAMLRTGKRETLVASHGDRWFEVTADPFYDSQGDLVGAVHIMVDITKRKQAEELLKQSRFLFEKTLSCLNEAVIIVDVGSRVIIDCNSATGTIFGYARDELVGRDTRFLHVNDEMFREFGERKLSDLDTKGFAEFKFQMKRKNGEVFPTEHLVRLLNDDAGNALGVVSVVRDIAERRLAEDAINRSLYQQKAILGSIPDMAWLKDSEGRFIAVNEAFTKACGRLPDDLVGMTDLDIWPKDLAEGYRADDRDVMQARKQKRIEETLQDKDGQTLWIETIKTPIYNEAGEVIGTAGIARDIAQRKQAADRLKAEKDRAQKYLDVAGVMMIVLDTEGRITLINKKGCALLGYEEQEIVGRTWFDRCLPGHIREEVKGVFGRLMAGEVKAVERYENPVLTKEQEVRTVAFINTVLRDEEGKISGVLFSGEDITEQKRAQDELNERARHAALGAEVGVVLTRGEGIRATLQQCAEAMVKHLDAAFARIWTLNEKDQVLEMQASAGLYTHINGAHGRVPVGTFKIGLIAKERKPHMTNEVVGDPWVGDQEWAKKERMVAFAGYPLVVQDRLVGVLAMFSRGKLAETTLNSLAATADIIALGIERKRAEESLEKYSEELTALNLASNTLIMITNIEDIFQEICDILFAVFDLRMIWLGTIDSESYEVKPAAHVGHEDGYLSAIRVTWDDAPTGMGPTGMSIKTRKPQATTLESAAFGPWKEEAKKRGFAASLAVPLISGQDTCVGALNFYSDRIDYFTEDRSRLCQIFANQAAVAIENARLVGGLEGKVTERTRALEDANVELRIVNREVELRREEAEAASRSKTDFLANMSHELRTPLNAILGFTEIMLTGMSGPMTEKQKEFLGDIAASGNHLLALITDILDLSKIEAGKVELESGACNVHELLESALTMFKERALTHRIKVRTEYDDSIREISADTRKLKQVMVNLLSNAFKFTPDGGSVTVAVRRVHSAEPGAISQEQKKVYAELRAVHSGADADFIEISVADTGIGISPENQQKLFKPFQQVETSLTKKFAGTGLGLSLCRRFVELHGGRIWIESGTGAGSRFAFIIPLRQADASI